MTAPQPSVAWDCPLPVGVHWPHDHTLVLINRELVSGVDIAALSRFGDDHWSLTEAVFEEHAYTLKLNFTAIPAPLRTASKHYIWQLINHDVPTPFHQQAVGKASIRTVMSAWPSFKAFTVWLNQRNIESFGAVDDDVLDRYLSHLADSETTLDIKHRRALEVRRLWSYRSILPESMRLPLPPPWNDDPLHELLGKSLSRRENRTPRIAEASMQALLHWALRFVEEFSVDIVSAHDEHLRLKGLSPQARRDRNGGRLGRSRGDEMERRVETYLARLQEIGGALPGKVDATGTIQLDLQHLQRQLEMVINQKTLTYPAGALIVQSDLPIADAAYLDTPITATLDGRPWRDRPIAYEEARTLANHLSTAAMIVITYLSGARPGEVLNLRRGCIDRDGTADMWLMSGLVFKNVVDDDGNKLPTGQQRRDPWVVVKPVADAVAVLERLHTHPLLFPARIQPYKEATNFARIGQARSSTRAIATIAEFIDWVNDYCTHHGRPGIPIDPHPINLSRFRRTLAWFIRRRPRGLVAGAIQYGHVHTRLIQGYAGDYSSGFPDEYAYEDFLARLEEMAIDHKALEDGEHVSGPAADEYRQRVHAAERTFAGHVLTTPRQARDLLGNSLLQIYHGDGMTCVFKAQEAACQLRGSVDDPMLTPDIDDCQPNCRCIAHTDRDVAAIQQHRDELHEIVNDPLAPPIRHQREHRELQRLDKILERHQ
ncbi:site-specific integrase [Mycolicibacterium wolinskyi]|uniref:Integrase n=1 Tax=Mycolicibacterium wolinskyi TaxID=59750 RepID=A0A1X2FIY0_9MYCO|nr:MULTISPECIES: site-specific integrase [Mycolicibacterium]MCV7288152.1 site-specific integrase [Mycolicibacterium wolinskyi]MCV7296877.1 site-specific integrase [Mycolicibacterium goodii]ORX18393.1 hypothetical protein AWC31_13875 [Mycolicibacterium wolinskyi]